MSIENRRDTRLTIKLSAELRIEGKTVTGSTRNLSSGGVCLELDRPIAEGSLVRFKLFVVEDGIETEGARGLDLTGTVQWAAESDNGHTVGIKFGALSPAQSAMLANALKAVGV